VRRALALIVAGSSLAAHAEFWDGNILHSRLTGAQNEQILGLGYVIGVADALNGVVFCPPENVTAGQIRDMVRNYLSNTPAERHLSADSIVSKVLKAVWPCAQRPQRGGQGV
jgi:hypothetical protein